MLFSRLSTVLLGFASVASASPVAFNALAVREASAIERGIVWAPRRLQSRDRNDNNRNNNNDRNRNQNNLIILQPVNVQVNQIQIIQEVQIVKVIQNIILVVGLDNARDNVRRNHYRNRNRNRDVNTVVIVVVVVVDARDRNNQRTRYVTRHVESNPEAATKEWVVVTEQSTLTVDSQPTATGIPGSTAVPSIPEEVGSEAVAPQVGVYDPSAALDVNTGDALLPSNIVVPSFNEARSEQDPAIILEANQNVFIVFDDQNDNRDGNNNNRGGDGRD